MGMKKGLIDLHQKTQKPLTKISSCVCVRARARAHTHTHTHTLHLQYLSAFLSAVLTQVEGENISSISAETL